jgi:hypothetical protein
MRKAIAVIAALVAALAITSVAGATSGLHSFGTGLTFTRGDGAAMFVAPGQYAGVYKGAKVRLVGKVRFSMTSWADVQGGAPRFSIALDTDGVKGTTESYAFLDAANCGGVVGTNPDHLPTLISTEAANCKVFLNTGGEFDNWAALVAAHPLWRTSLDPSFVIADVPGSYLVTGIRLYS